MCLIGLVVIALTFYHYFAQNTLDKVNWRFDGNGIILEEAKYFWGGTWFNKDKVSISPQGFYIEKISLIRGTQSLMIPYNKVKRVVLEKGAIINRIVVVSEGGFFSKSDVFHIKNKNNFGSVTGVVWAYCQNQCTIVEKESVLYSLGKRFGEIKD